MPACVDSSVGLGVGVADVAGDDAGLAGDGLAVAGFAGAGFAGAGFAGGG
jgi:hypothetical protein